MLPGFLRALWGDLSPREVKKFSLLSLIITIILGNYWMLRSMKNPIFQDLVGMEYQPYAKMASIVVVAIVISIYSKLVDMFQKHTLFYIICSVYAALFLFLGYATARPEIFSLSPTSPLNQYFTWLPGTAIGWISYFTFESSSLLMILFWAFVASITKPESAKKGYAMIVTCIQVGTISGPAIVTNFAPKVGVPTLVALGGVLVLTVPFLVKLYMKVIPPEKEKVEEDSSGKKKPKTGFFEGIRLIFTKPYVLGILVVSTVYEIIATVLEFQMNMIARDVFPTRDLYAAFTGKYGMSINFMALLFALLGTSFFMRKFGLRFCLVVYPITIGFVLLGLLGLNFAGANHSQIMWSLFGSMIAVKGFSYALNNPTKEVMYIPTTKDIRYKAKGWIESFGGRAAKGTGSTITAAFAKNVPALLFSGTIISLGVVGVWLFIANLLGKKYNKLQATNSTVE
ncbi:MAG: NTP/NDP exchange transporter [Chlamydiota bacterium]